MTEVTLYLLTCLPADSSTAHIPTVSEEDVMEMHRYWVLMSACLCQAIFAGIMYGTSPLLVGILDTFRTTRVQAGLVLSLIPTCYCFTAIFAGAFVHKYGAWITCALGSAIIALAFGVSFVATSVLYLIIVVGVFAGFGQALMFVSCVPTVCHHFSGRAQVMALTVMSMCNGLGAMTYSYVLGVMLENYGLRGTCLLIGGFTLNATVISPLWKSKSKIMTKTQSVIITESAVTNSSVSTEVSSSNNIKTAYPVEKTTAKMSLKEMFRFVFTNKAFVLFAIGNGTTIAAHLNALIYMVDAMQDYHANSVLVSLTPVFFNLSALIGRLLCGTIKLIPHCSSLDIAILSAILGVGGCTLIALVDLVDVKVFAWCVNGVAMGMGTAGTTITTARLLGKEGVSTGIGLLSAVAGAMVALGGSINGYIRDVTGSYQFGLIYTSGVLFIVGIVYTLAKVYRLRETSPNSVTVIQTMERSCE